MEVLPAHLWQHSRASGTLIERLSLPLLIGTLTATPVPTECAYQQGGSTGAACGSGGVRKRTEQEMNVL